MRFNSDRNGLSLVTSEISVKHCFCSFSVGWFVDNCDDSRKNLFILLLKPLDTAHVP